MTSIRTALALAAATALGAATLPATAQTTTTTPIEPAPMESTGAIGGVAQVFATADDLDDVEVWGSNGEEIGEVEDVVVDASGAHFEVGGFLGIGEDEVAIPMDRFAARGDEGLVLVGMTEDELEALAEAQEDMAGYTTIEGATAIELRTME